MRGKKSNTFIIFGLALLLLSIGVFNIYDNGKDFFELTIYQMASLLIVLFITFYLTQTLNEQRRKIDILDKMISEIQIDLKNECLIKFETEDDRNIALLHQKSIANRLKYLIDSNVFPGIIDDIKYTNEEVQRLRNMYGDHMTDIDYMRKSKKEFKLYITNAEDKLFAIHIKLYK